MVSLFALCQKRELLPFGVNQCRADQSTTKKMRGISLLI
nr:MAG TPA: hypothetical protein [Caudoviricetes sp.]